MSKKPLIISIILIVLLIITAFLFYILYQPEYEKNQIDNPLSEQELNPNLTESRTITITPIFISYILNEVQVYKLHNPPLSSDTPKILTELNNKYYTSEIKSGIITTEEKYIENPDLIIYTTEQEIILSIQSLNTTEYFKLSINQGKTTLELKSSYTKLFSKGYLSLYQELTGKSLSGSIIRIFKQ